MELMREVEVGLQALEQNCQMALITVQILIVFAWVLCQLLGGEQRVGLWLSGSQCVSNGAGIICKRKLWCYYKIQGSQETRHENCRVLRWLEDLVSIKCLTLRKGTAFLLLNKQWKSDHTASLL